MQTQKALAKKIAKHPKETLATLDEDQIAAVIQFANYQYHSSDKPVFTDAMFDLIKDHLESLNPRHPILKHVGAVVSDSQRKATLPYWMGSMDKIKSDSATLKRWTVAFPGAVVVSHKLDGVSALFCWKMGTPTFYTRGNGVEGQIITHVLPFIRGIPTNDDAFKNVKECVVRGELIMSKDDFEGVKDQGANARNMVSGMLNAKVPNLEVARRTRFVAYELIQPVHKPSKQIQVMRDMGFEVVSNRLLETSAMNADILSGILTTARSESKFEIDGIIVAHDAVHTRKAGENPKHAFAFKSVAMMDRAEVVVTSVEWNVSKDGYIKPVVIFDGVSIGGVKVQRATGFNARFIKDNRIGPGAKLVVMRSGDVIPNIVEVLEAAREAAMPDDIKFAWNESGIDIVADKSNAQAQDSVRLKKLVFFFSNIKVKGLSEGTLKKLCAAGLDSVGDILAADKTRLLSVDGFKEKLADNIVTAIRSTFDSGNIDPVALMEASNAFGRGLGEKKLNLIANEFPEAVTDEAFEPSIQDLVRIPGIEKKTAEQFLQGRKDYWKFAKANDLTRFHAVVPAAAANAPPSAPQIFKDKSFVFSGVRNKVVEDFIVKRGGKIKTGMSKNIDVLVCKDPDATTGKISEARELGITITSLDAFVEAHGIVV
jgi:DNA ligase (NAD+)